MANLIQKYLEILKSPETGEGLELVDNKLKTKSGIEYNIVEGIPVLIDLKNLPEHLQSQVNYFKKEFSVVGKYKLDKWEERYVERFIENYSNVKDKLVIDCGAGAGYMTIELAKRGAFVIATDLTIESLTKINAYAKELGLEDKILCVCCDSQKLPFADNVFDFFISNAVLEHLPKEPEAIEEIARTTKEQSNLMITVPLMYRFTNPIFLPLNIYYDRKIGHLRRYDDKVLQKKFSKYGFKVTRTYFTGHFLKVLNSILTLGFKFDKLNSRSEEDDKKKESRKIGASNVIAFLSR